MPKLTVVIPTYNEANNVGPMTEALFALDIPTLDILIVDDESPDGTGRIADDLAVQRPDRVHVLHRTGQRGLGLAYIACGRGFTLCVWGQDGRRLGLGALAAVLVGEQRLHAVDSGFEHQGYDGRFQVLAS